METVRERWDILGVIAVGGAAGSVARWGVGELLPHTDTEFPLSTFVVNVLGSFLLGVLMVFVLEVWPPTRYLRPFLGVGVMGGFTTFSTFVADDHALVSADQAVTAVVYTLVTVGVVLLAVALGVFTARALVGGRRHRHRRQELT